MGSPLPIGRFFGADVRIDPSVLLLIAVFGFQGFDDGGYQGVLDALTFLALLLVSVVLHEVGHALAAAAFGLQTVEIALTFFGGYARFAEPPQRRREQAAIALAGPAVNLTIAGLLSWLLAEGARGNGFAFVEAHAGLLGDLRFANLFLGVFNLLPAFPFDGGTFTRAVLSLWLSRGLARFVVACLGIAVGIALAAFGFFWSLPFTIFLGVVFVFMSTAEVGYARREMNG